MLVWHSVVLRKTKQAHAPAPFSWMDETRGLQMAPFSRKKQKTKRGRSHQSTSITAGQPSAFQAGSCFDNTDQDGRAATTHCPVKSPSCRADSNLGGFCTTPPCPRFWLLLPTATAHGTSPACRGGRASPATVKKIAQPSAHPLGRPRPRPRHLHLLRAPTLRRPLPFSQPTPLSPVATAWRPRPRQSPGRTRVAVAVADAPPPHLWWLPPPLPSRLGPIPSIAGRMPIGLSSSSLPQLVAAVQSRKSLALCVAAPVKVHLLWSLAYETNRPPRKPYLDRV
jgi:hypothetical protein